MINLTVDIHLEFGNLTDLTKQYYTYRATDHRYV